MKKTLNMLLAALFLTAGFPVFAESSRYTIFVDAGSSGSRLHIFQYHNNKTLPDVHEMCFVNPGCSANLKPGLAFFQKNPGAAGASLKPALDQAAAWLAGAGVRITDVPVHVWGTGGMRLLSDAEQAAIYASVTETLKKYSFVIEPDSVKTIPGKMEGLYGWLDVNYLQNNFSNHQPTIGSIDMGGASTQIVFAMPKQDDAFADDIITVHINHQKYTVFSKSFLGLGQDQMRLNLKDPLAAACYPDGYAFDPNDPTRIGKFDFANCTYAYKSMIDAQGISHQIPREVRGQTFVAYSGIFYTWQFFNLIDKSHDPATVQMAIQGTCQKSWEQLQKEHPGDKYLAGYCANGAYENQLLYTTYGLQWPLLTVAGQINQMDIDWTLGAALYSVLGKS